MSEQEPSQPLSEKSEDTKEPIVYASPVKRVWAWVGVAYMVIITLLFTWYIAHANFLNGIGALMLCPALAGVGISAIVSYRTGNGRGGLLACILISAVAFLLVAVNLIAGVPALLAQLGG